MPSWSGNRGILLVGLAILVIVIIGVAVLLLSSSGASHDTASPQSPISITSLQNDVLVKAVNTDFHSVNGQATTTSGSTIKTSASGRALISSANSHTTLVDYSSEIVLSQDASKRTSVGLLAGAVWSRLEKTFDSGEYYEIKTGNAVASVRGTSFGVWYAAQTTTLIVTGGSVLFSAVDPSTGLPIPDTGVLVTAGQKAIREGNGKIVVTPASGADLARPWLVFNTDKNAPVVPATAVPAAASPTGPAGGSSMQTQQPASPAPSTQQAGASGTPPSQTPSSDPTLAYLTPTKVPASSGETITLKGNNLIEVRTLRIDSVSVTFTVSNPSTATFTTEDLGPGTYDVSVTSRSGKTATLTQALTITPAAQTTKPAGTVSPNSVP